MILCEACRESEPDMGASFRDDFVTILAQSGLL